MLKTIGGPYRGKTVDFTSGAVTEVTIEAADEKEIAATIAVMGGEDWRSWIDTLREQDLLAEGARTLAYSYVGPKLTWPIYRQGHDRRGEKRSRADCRRLELQTCFSGGRGSVGFGQ